MQLRPLSLGELLDAALKIYRGRARTLILAVAVPVLPVVAFQTLVTWSTQPEGYDPFDFSTTAEEAPEAGEMFLQLAGSLVSAMAIVLASSLATAACFRAISSAYLGDEVDWRESLRFAVSRLWSVIGLSVVVGMATLLGLLLCIVGVIVPLTWFAIATPALLMEGLGVGEAMGRSKRLASPRFWPVLGAVLVSTLLALVFQAIISAPAGFVMASSSSLIAQIIYALVTAVGMILVTPFTAAFAMALYVDLRVRHEGFDLYLWAQRVGAEPTGGFPSQPGASSWGAMAADPHAGFGPPPGAGGFGPPVDEPRSSLPPPPPVTGPGPRPPHEDGPTEEGPDGRVGPEDPPGGAG